MRQLWKKSRIRHFLNRLKSERNLAYHGRSSVFCAYNFITQDQNPGDRYSKRVFHHQVVLRGSKFGWYTLWWELTKFLFFTNKRDHKVWLLSVLKSGDPNEVIFTVDEQERKN